MDIGLARRIMDTVALELSQFEFTERRDNVTNDITGVVKKSWNPFRRVFGRHGMSAVVVVPESVTDRDGLKAFFQNVRQDIDSQFVGFAAYTSPYSFVVLLCSHRLFGGCPGVALELTDGPGLHMNTIQGVILVDSETREVTGDHTWPWPPARDHRREYAAVLSATIGAVK